MVIRAGGDSLKSSSIAQLVKDMRNVMQPHTAINFRERKSNKIKDYVVMAGPLGVTQMMIFNQNENGSTHMRLATAPKGPTLTFKVNSYSLNKDVRRFLRKPKSLGKESSEFLNPPLLVLNGFTNPKTAEPHEKVVITMFQNMFPPISPQTTKVGSIKRVLMLNKNKETGEIDLRHYVIDTKLVDGTKNVKKLINAKSNLHRRIPNLGKTQDVSDLVLDPYANPYTSESEVEDDAVVEIKNDDEIKVLTKPKNLSTSKLEEKSDVKKRAVKLTEVGPRLNLSLIKIEEGICSGKILYHSYINKSDKEIKSLEAKHKKRQREKDERRKEQAANVKLKKDKKEAKKLRRKLREEAIKRGDKVDLDESDDESSSDEDEVEIDSEDYANDSDLYSE